MECGQMPNNDSPKKPAEDPMDEEVLVIPTAHFRELGYFQGFTSHVERYIPGVFSPEKISFRPRREVERDPDFKQLIPYVVIAHLTGDNGWSVYHYTRGVGQGESRLRQKRSVGIGGHVSRCDAEKEGDVFYRALLREVGEEVAINCPFESECVGLINDDLTEVGRVHLGIVYRFRVRTREVFPRERDVIGHGFATPEELVKNWSEFETWSQLVLEGLFGVEPVPGQGS